MSIFIPKKLSQTTKTVESLIGRKCTIQKTLKKGGERFVFQKYMSGEKINWVCKIFQNGFFLSGEDEIIETNFILKKKT